MKAPGTIRKGSENEIRYRILVCEFHQETNTFNPLNSGIEQFEAIRYLKDEAFFDVCRELPCAVHGMIDAIEEEGCTAVPTIDLCAQSCGRVRDDVFELLPTLEQGAYDFIILDPPAFTKSRKTLHNALRGYKEINYRAMKLLPRGGYLATCSCSHFATEEEFCKMLVSAAKDANVQLRQIEARQQSPDHPILWGVPETSYLKFYLFQVV